MILHSELQHPISHDRGRLHLSAGGPSHKPYMPDDGSGLKQATALLTSLPCFGKRELEPTPAMNFDFNRERTILGTVFTHAGEEELSLSELDRMNHMLMIGKTGMGKTRTLKNIIIQDIHTGRGVGVIDPHGDLQNELLNEIPRRRARDLVYLDPNDPE